MKRNFVAELMLAGMFLLCSFAQAQENNAFERIFGLERSVTNFFNTGFNRNAIPAPIIYCNKDGSNDAPSTVLEPSYQGVTGDESQMYRIASDSSHAEIKVFYNGFSKQAKEAFQFAVDIWSTKIRSKVPIRVFANWRALSPNLLGSAYAGTYQNYGLFRNFNGAPRRDTWYPTALAEKLSEVKINEDYESDIVANFNANNPDWYYGTDGRTPKDKYDLSSIILHELCHGLGFFATNQLDTIYGVNGNVGFWGLGSDIPSTYDRQIVNGQGNAIIDLTKYPMGSKALLNQFTSNNLYFNGFTTKLALNNRPAKLYAPAAYAQGSSISHLDNVNVNFGDPNSLMLPTATKGTHIHEPGNVIQSMMNDLGWENTKIIYQTKTDTEDGFSELVFKIKVLSDNGIKTDSVFIAYTLDNFLSPPQLKNMTRTSIPDEYSVTIDNPGLFNQFNYYFVLKDNHGKLYHSPANKGDKINTRLDENPNQIYSLNIQPDIQKPYIFHGPISTWNKSDTSAIRAYTSDNLGVKSLSFDYFLNGIRQTPIMLQNDTLDSYKFYLNTSVRLNDGDSILYRFISTDSSIAKNKAFFPDSGFFKLLVEPELKARTFYKNDFNTPTKDFAFDSRSFSIETPVGFTNSAVHSKHPYSDGLYPYNFKVDEIRLKVPIIVNYPTSYIQFDEILLMQPAAPRSKYYSSDFKDFIYVDASKDKGVSWYGLAFPYNTNANKEWTSIYNSSIDANSNSLAKGNSAMFRTRRINMLKLGNFIPAIPNTNTERGDTILIRFRMISNETKNGWGWAMDNLLISTSPYITTDQNAILIKDDLVIYPTQNDGNFTIETTRALKFKTLNISVQSILGYEIYNESIENNTNAPAAYLSKSIHLNQANSGVYFVKINIDGVNIQKKIIID